MPGRLVAYPEFIGGTYSSRSFQAGDCQRSMNLFPELIESKAGKNLYYLYRTPGLKLWATLPKSPVQAEYELNGRAWAIAGNEVYEIFADGSFADRGAISAPPAGQYITICANESNQLFIVSPPNGFILDTAANTITPITAAGFLGAQTGTMVDGYFVANAPNTPTFSVSDFENGLAWQGINQQSTQDYADNLVAVDNFVHYLALFGKSRSEAYYNTGANTTIFARYEGSYQYHGCAAAWSRVHLDNTIFYLGHAESGQALVFRLDGFTPKRVSDHSFETAVQQYSSVTDATAYAYQEGGHHFYVIHFPSANNSLGATWAYDVNTQKWHERGYWNAAAGQYQAALGRFHIFAFGKHLVGDYQSGNIYEQSLAYADDNGQPIYWLRQAPHLYSSNVRTFYHQMILDMRTGTGGSVTLAWSNDGGFTWSNPLATSIGSPGQYNQRVTFDRLGHARDRVFRFSGSDQTPELCLTNAYLYLTPGNS